MRPFVPTLIAFFLVVLAGSATPTLAADAPTPYPADAKAWPGEGAIRVFGWMTEDRKRFWKERERKQGALVLAGDSLLGGWKSAEQDLAPAVVANRGVGGDTSRGLVFRFQEDVLDLKPSRIVLLIGGNDLSAHQDPRQTARNIERVLDAAAAQDPKLPVVLCTLTPRANPAAPVKPGDFDALNGHIRRIAAARPNVTLLDLQPWFTAADGSPEATYFGKDRLHLNAKGYERFHEALRTVLPDGR
jgi:lysophospholipase L1-like esterase